MKREPFCIKWDTLAFLLLLRRFSRVRLCATPQTAANPASHPWDSPGKNTGVGCRFLLQCMKVKSEREVAQSCPTLGDPMDCSPPGSSVHGSFQAKVLEWGAIALRDEKSYFWCVRWGEGCCYRMVLIAWNDVIQFPQQEV